MALIARDDLDAQHDAPTASGRSIPDEVPEAEDDALAPCLFAERRRDARRWPGAGAIFVSAEQVYLRFAHRDFMHANGRRDVKATLRSGDEIDVLTIRELFEVEETPADVDHQRGRRSRNPRELRGRRSVGPARNDDAEKKGRALTRRRYPAA